MQIHAVALLTQKPKRLGPTSLPLLEKALILDLEYETMLRRQIFAASVLVVESGIETELFQYYAESLDDEERILREFAKLLEKYENYPILTWNGTAADLVEITNAWARVALPESWLTELRDRHVDLFAVVKKGFRLPTVSFQLKEVAAYFGFVRTHPDTSSFEIPYLYGRYLGTKDEGIKKFILEHNADDVRSVLHVWDSLASLNV